MSSDGVYSRGQWVDLSTDEDGLWNHTPYMIDPSGDSFHCNESCIRRCSTDNDVKAAASCGLLFGSYEAAANFVAELARQNEELNVKAEGAELEDDEVYCPVCGHCGETGCCGIENFIEAHLKGKTGCPYGDSILQEIEDNFDEYRRTISGNYQDITVYMIGELKKDPKTKQYKIERVQGRRGGHIYSIYKHAENAYREWIQYHPNDHSTKIWALSGSLLELKSPEIPKVEEPERPEIITLKGKLAVC